MPGSATAGSNMDGALSRCLSHSHLSLALIKRGMMNMRGTIRAAPQEKGMLLNCRNSTAKLAH